MKLAPYFFLLLVPAVPWAQREVDRRTPPATRAGLLYLRSGQEVRRLWPGLEDLMADVYWLRAVQYNGRQILFPEPEPFVHLGPLLDVTVTLDPRLEIAYWYGAIFLAEDPPRGKGAPLEGKALLERGVRARPDSWRLRQHLAFLHYLYLDDPRTAGEILVPAARLPGAPFWLDTLAAKLLAEGRDRERARSIWRHFYETSEGVFRENALYHLQRLDALDVVDAWNALLERERAAGRTPRSMAELLARGGGHAPAHDPLGVPFVYDAERGRVGLSRQSRLWRSKDL